MNKFEQEFFANHPPKTFPTLEEMLEPSLNVLTELIDYRAEHPAITSQAVWSIIVNVWQQLARPFYFAPPSLILVSHNQEIDTAYDKFRLGMFGSDHAENTEEDSRPSSITIPFCSPEGANAIMANVYQQNHQHVKATRGLISNNSLIESYYKAKAVGYGSNISYEYLKPRHPQLGLITDGRGTAVLQISNPEDFNAFNNDLMKDSKLVSAPKGPASDISSLEHKNISYAGSITASSFSHEFLDKTLSTGIPFLFQPEIKGQLPPHNNRALVYLTTMFKELEDQPMLPSANIEVTEPYNDFIWSILQELPDPYRYNFLNLVHQIDRFSSVLTGITMQHSPTLDVESPEVKTKHRHLCSYIHYCGQRNLCISLAMLAWHCIGFKLPCSLNTARKVMTELRDNKNLSLRELHRKCFKNASDRDKVLAILQDKGLVSINNKTVTAVSLEEYYTYIQELPAIPPIEQFLPKKVESN